ncbi:PepSY domain-containing protein [Candidatus Woesearchaeota archaeon]|nr:PepSY domain-containing protein [Candidatus Woesearchaeota archaeon]
MELKDVLRTLEQSKEYSAWRKEHAKSFLAHAFLLLDEANKDTWQLGYYNPEDTITTFVVSAKYVEIIPDQEILRSDNAILELKPEDVVIGHESALKTAKEQHVLQHPREIPLKTFFIIQNNEGKAIYNITYFFQSMKTLNLKIDAKDGKLLSQSFQTLMEFDKKA